MEEIGDTQGALSFSDSWQRKVLVASQYIESDNDYDNHVEQDWFFLQMDNTSNRCMTFPVESCSCEPRILLKWARILFYKVARTYVAKPLLLALLPLCIGVLVGIWIGKNSQTKQQQDDSSSSIQGSTLSFRIIHTLCKWLVPQENLQRKENRVRTHLKSDVDTKRESGVDIQDIPKHVAVIMDGNRRYGKARYGNVAKGHWDGSKTLVDFAKWCIAEGIQVLTVYAFSTENWNREPSEVASLMQIFAKYCDELRIEALQRNIRIHVLSTESDRIPGHVKAGLQRMVQDTRHCENGLTMNICLSYGSRGEIVNACKALAIDARDGTLSPETISEHDVQRKLLTNHCPDPDVVIRTSGEYRLSNFLLWQLAYAELFFVPKQWPELKKKDLLQVIRTYAHGRRRRFGK
mmetsp:Transcript_24329/g.44010  ORF Transcript_24329/g.44010 Transcript_24329/m.44010 type:complete len:406 (-) Transcript_24329:41-1258(-)